MQTNKDQADKIACFRELHESGCFVMPNAWDSGTAKYLEVLGFEALATTSAGLCFAKARQDAPGAISVEDTLSNACEIVDASALPVNVDFQNGYASDPEAVSANVYRCLATGAAGLSIEDASGNSRAPLYDYDLAVERIGAAREQIDHAGNGAVLTARCEAWLVGDPTPLRTALTRLVGYAEAGADCLFAPGVVETAEIETLVRAISPLALNVLVGRPIPGLDVRRLADLGVRRVSVGSALNRVAWKAFMGAASSILATGEFESLSSAVSFSELDSLFALDSWSSGIDRTQR